jgi:hypothetical protein
MIKHPLPAFLALAEFGVLYHAEVVPPAYFIGQIKQFLPCLLLLAALIFMCLKGLVIVHIAVIEYHMKMHMSLINMNSKVILILPFEELFA